MSVGVKHHPSMVVGVNTSAFVCLGGYGSVIETADSGTGDGSHYIVQGRFASSLEACAFSFFRMAN
jgi:hypothetical protein